MAKKKACKKSCGKKCNKKNCELKSDAQKRCNNQLPEFSSQEFVLEPKSKAAYLYNYIKKVLGYGNDSSSSNNS